MKPTPPESIMRIVFVVTIIAIFVMFYSLIYVSVKSDQRQLERLTKEAASLSEQYDEQERQVKKAVSDFNTVTHSLAEQLWTPENDTCQMCGHGGRR